MKSTGSAFLRRIVRSDMGLRPWGACFSAPAVRYAGRSVGIAAGLVMAALLFTPALPVDAQTANPARADDSSGGEVPSSENLPDPAVELADLLVSDTSDWMDALNALRENPEKSREVMMLAVQQDLQSPNRWRIFHHIIEFGQAEDIPLLLERVGTAATPLERIALEGSARALYPAAYKAEDLSRVVEVFSFSQAGSAKTLDGRNTGRLVMSRNVFANYHREGLPIGVIKRLLPLLGRSYASRDSVKRVIRRELRKKTWKKYKEKLLEPVQPVPVWQSQEGLLRFSLRNPLSRPLMLKVAFNAWGSRLEPELEPRYVYLAPEEGKQVDIPVRVVKNRDTPTARIGMRMWEVHGPFVPIFQKLYITF